MKDVALNDDFRDLLGEFLAEQVDFLLIGALALAFHGYPRATGDMDILVRPSFENAPRVWRALKRFGAPLEAAGVSEEDFTNPGLVYQIGLPPRRIDILTEISGLSYDEASESKQETTVDGLTIGVLGRAALIKNKRSTGRTQDLADAEKLEEAGD